MAQDRKRARRRTKEPPANAVERICLRCGKPFVSDGTWNRICMKCNRFNQALSRLTQDAPSNFSGPDDD